MKQLTVEHQAVFNFKTAACHLRPLTETDVAQQDYKDFYDAFTGAIASFIDSELNYRQASRCQQVGISPDLGTYSEGMGAKLNTAGIGYLTESLLSFTSFSDQQIDLPIIDIEFQQELADFKTQMREVLVRLEMKGSDALELSNQIEEAASTLVPGNTGKELLDRMGQKVQELINVRNQPGRGAESNIAIWKLIAAVVMLGMAMWIVYKCYYSRWSCSKKQKATYDTILGIAIIVFGACE